MKKLCMILILSIMLVGAIGCDAVPPVKSDGTSDTQSTLEDKPAHLKEYFDTDREQKPTEEDMRAVSEAISQSIVDEKPMSIAEVIERIGKPHDFGPTSGVTTLMWETDAGNAYHIVFIPASDAPENLSAIETLMKHSLAARVSPAVNGN